jgi:hypothetical protein
MPFFEFFFDLLRQYAVYITVALVLTLLIIATIEFINWRRFRYY